MKILFPIGAFFPAQTGGPSNSVYWLICGLRTYGIHATVVATYLGIKLEHEIPANQWLREDSVTRIYQKTLIHYLPIRAFYKVWQSIGTAHVVHLTNLFYPLSFFTALLVKFYSGKVLVWSCRGELDPDALKYSYWKKFFILNLIRLLNHNKQIIFHSTCDSESIYIQSHFGSSARVIQIPNLVVLPDRINEVKGSYFLYLGRIHPKKAIENLIIAFAEAPLFLSTNYELRIAGNDENEYGAHLHDLVDKLGLKNKVLFLGHVDGVEKQRLLAGAYFSFMPSHTENFGNVVVEAMAQGTPVVASQGTPWSVLDEFKAGFWVKNDSNSLKLVIDQIIGMAEDEYMIYSMNALELSRKYDTYENSKKWVEFYELLSSKS